MTHDRQHPFRSLFAICISSLVRYLLNVLVHSLIGLFVFLVNFKSSLNILDYSLLSECPCKYFLLVYGLCSHTLNIVFHRAVSILRKFILSVIYFMDNAIDIVLPYPRPFIFSHLLYLELLFYICISVIVHLGLWSILSYFLWRLWGLDSF